MTKAANTLVTPDPSGDIHRSRLEQADAPILALGAELRENRAAVDAESDRADALQEANPDDAETRAAVWAIRDACRPLTHRYHAILNELRDQPALTLAGMAVKSRAILQWLSPGGDEVPDASEDGRVAWSLAHDVLRLAEVSRHDGASPDAALIALGRECVRIEHEQAEIEAATDRVRATGGDVRPLNERSDAITDRVGEIIEAATVLLAYTPDGISAKVAILGDSWSYALRDLDRVGDSQHELAWSIVRDMAGMAS